MATNPSKLDVIDSKLSSEDTEGYKLRKREYDSTLNEHWEFEVVPDVFKQSLNSTDETSFNYLDENFGILHSWDDIITKLNTLNKNIEDKTKTQYKLLFLSRHGQGYHNLAHAKYGNDAWNDYWSKLNGDGKIVWGPDPLLTDLGKSQAKENSEFWKQQLRNNKNKNQDLIKPTAFFVSPLSRSIDTLIGTWGDIIDIKAIKPLIQDNLRETAGVHTCDKRSSRTIIAQKYESKGFVIEPGFVEEDVYFKPDYRETVGEQSLRIYKQFQFLFNGYPNDEVISITSHSGTIRAQLLVLGHRSFAVGTGGIIPVFVKATKVEKK
ncbi:phosphoglycerate mutase [Scheffersomyces amazonensis]|uniref:phosphoglycerate mutase n=1 Tax=Scheffersomyces amazonensis TaxID=1078765 RepID=UPI00315D49FA